MCQALLTFVDTLLSFREYIIIASRKKGYTRLQKLKLITFFFQLFKKRILSFIILQMKSKVSVPHSDSINCYDMSNRYLHTSGLYLFIILISNNSGCLLYYQNHYRFCRFIVYQGVRNDKFPYFFKN